MLAISYGVMECQGILGSQALGEKNYAKVNLRLRQGIVVGLTYFVIGTCIPTVFIDDILPLFGVQAELNQIVKELIIWTLPSTAIRIINDNLKTFLQNQG
jgi:Na+-driven multidrug efflux pump